MQQSHIERAKVSLEGRRVRIRGENPSAVYFVTGQHSPSCRVPLDELPQVGTFASLVLDVPGAKVNPWRRSTWPTGAARTCATADLIPVTARREPGECTFGCAVRRRDAWDDASQRVRAINCICGADPIDAEAESRIHDPADEETTSTAPDSKTRACGPDRD